MKIKFLGTNGWYDTDTGNTVSVLIKTEKYTIILDAGYGIHKLQDILENNIKYSETTEIYLFLSHFHIDHITGLHTIDKLKNCKKLYISGPLKIKETLNKFINSPFTKPMKDYPFEIIIYELPEEMKKLPFSVECLPMVHSDLTYGYRFNIDNKIITYCTDTGYSENIIKLGNNADLLITECALLPGENDESWPHLNPEIAAEMANMAKAKKLALMHFDASKYKTLEDRIIAEKTAKNIFKNSIAAFDNMEIEL